MVVESVCCKYADHIVARIVRPAVYTLSIFLFIRNFAHKKFFLFPFAFPFFPDFFLGPVGCVILFTIHHRDHSFTHTLRSYSNIALLSVTQKKERTKQQQQHNTTRRRNAVSTCVIFMRVPPMTIVNIKRREAGDLELFGLLGWLVFRFGA